jgi:LPXTG-site transpeptidase (sortase) family protein
LSLGIAYYAYAAVAQSHLSRLEKEQSGPLPPLSSEVLPSWVEGPSVPVNSLSEFPPPTRLAIPSLDIDAPVVEVDIEWQKGELTWTVGHYRNSANPGQPGDVIMYGHKSSYIRGEGSIFRNLYKIGLGDPIYVATANNWYRYRVDKVEIADKNDVSVLTPIGQPRLILITCEPNFVYSHRLVVKAGPD